VNAKGEGNGEVYVIYRRSEIITRSFYVKKIRRYGKAGKCLPMRTDKTTTLEKTNTEVVLKEIGKGEGGKNRPTQPKREDPAKRQGIRKESKSEKDSVFLMKKKKEGEGTRPARCRAWEGEKEGGKLRLNCILRASSAEKKQALGEKMGAPPTSSEEKKGGSTSRLVEGKKRKENGGGAGFPACRQKKGGANHEKKGKGRLLRCLCRRCGKKKGAVLSGRKKGRREGKRRGISALPAPKGELKGTPLSSGKGGMISSPEGMIPVSLRGRGSTPYKENTAKGKEAGTAIPPNGRRSFRQKNKESREGRRISPPGS